MSTHTYDHEKYATFGIIEAAGAAVMFLVGWHWLALGWVGMAITDILTYEWADNPDQYGWFGDNPLLGGMALNVVTMLYFVGYLALLVLGLV